MRSMVEGPLSVRRTPPPRFARSPSPRNRVEDFQSLHMMLCDKGVHTPVFTPACRKAAPVHELQV